MTHVSGKEGMMKGRPIKYMNKWRNYKKEMPESKNKALGKYDKKTYHTRMAETTAEFCMECASLIYNSLNMFYFHQQHRDTCQISLQNMLNKRASQCLVNDQYSLFSVRKLF